MVMYLLDTNICIYLLNNRPEKARQRLEQVDIKEVFISSITFFELDSGSRKGIKVAENLARLQRFISTVKVLPFDLEEAREAGILRQHLNAIGQPIGNFDLLIAGHALALDAVVVTNNVKEFERVPRLKVENWLE
jgi:tRNA(fMet)-specific endonuclease VapC